MSARRRRSHGSASLAFALLTVPAGVVHAQAPAPPLAPEVRIARPRCAQGPFDFASFTALLELELRNEGVTISLAETTTRRPLATVSVEPSTCAPSADEVQIAIEDAGTRKRLSRDVDVRAVPPLNRPRALALAVAELLRASWAELLVSAEAEAGMPEALRARLRVRLGLAPEPGARRPHVTVLLESRLLRAHNGALLGARGVTSLPLSTHVFLRLDAGGAVGQGFDPLGEVDLALASGGTGVFLRAGGERTILEVGPRIEVGWARAVGQPADPMTGAGRVSAAFIAADALASLRLALPHRLWATAELEAGLVLSGIDTRADDRRTSGFGGPQVILRIGLALSF